MFFFAISAKEMQWGARSIIHSQSPHFPVVCHSNRAKAFSRPTFKTYTEYWIEMNLKFGMILVWKTEESLVNTKRLEL